MKSKVLALCFLLASCGGGGSSESGPQLYGVFDFSEDFSTCTPSDIADLVLSLYVDEAEQYAEILNSQDELFEFGNYSGTLSITSTGTIGDEQAECITSLTNDHADDYTTITQICQSQSATCEGYWFMR